MKRKIQISIIFTLFFIGNTNILAQQFISEQEEKFAFQVKIVDEFIERFNDVAGNLADTYVQENRIGAPLDRKANIKSLFNQSIAWDTTVISFFLNSIVNNKKPILIDFYDQNWFAKVNCRFLYKGRVQNVDIVLDNQVLEEKAKASKWVIIGVSGLFLGEIHDCEENIVPASRDRLKSLNPMSHGTDFMGLRKAFADKENLRNYFCQKCNSETVNAMANELYKGNLVFEQVNGISYHFLQVPGWVFTVNEYLRNSINSGWLIDKLIRADDKEKKAYMQQQLFLQR